MKLTDFSEAIESSATLSRQQAYQAMELLLDPEMNQQIAADFLVCLNKRLPTVAEMSGYIDYLSERCMPCNLASDQHFDLCGTGGDGKNTINISTLSAFLLAAMGEKVAKHGNYAASSSVGSSNLLEALKVPLFNEAAQLKESFERTGLVFLHAPYWHPALKVIAPVRKSLGVRTVFNLMGPLLNPARPAFQIAGAPTQQLARLLAEVQALRTAGSFASVSDQNGYDEISLTTSSNVFKPCADGKIQQLEVGPDTFQILQLDADSIKGTSDIEQLLNDAESILKGKAPKPQLQVISANVALALHLKYQDKQLSELFSSALTVLESGKAFELLEELRGVR